MNDFQLYNPVKLVFGLKALHQIPTIIKNYDRILLLHSGDVIQQIGLYDELKSLLEDHSIIEYNAISSNPTYEACMPCVEMVKNNPVDLILAVGGGSVIDAGKFIRAALAFEGDPWDLLEKGAPVPETMPMAVVLTIAATGSEMNCNSVISRESTKEKLSFSHPHLFPMASFLDPQVTVSLPQRQTSNGIIDSFAHILEQYLAVNEMTDLQDRFAEGTLRTILKHGEIVLKDPNNIDSRSALMFSATMALNGIITVGTNGDWAAHMIGHELTSLYSIDHAITVALIMPGLYRTLIKQKEARLALMAREVWGLSSDDDSELAVRCIEEISSFFERIAGKKLSLALHVPDDIKEAADKICERFARRGTILGELGNVDSEMVREILYNC